PAFPPVRRAGQCSDAGIRLAGPGRLCRRDQATGRYDRAGAPSDPRSPRGCRVTGPPTVEVRLPSRLGFEKVAMGTASSMAKLMGFADERIEDLKTAVAEACINAIEHGNHFREDLKVGVILSMNGDALEVKVIDNGTGMMKH